MKRIVLCLVVMFASIGMHHLSAETSDIEKKIAKVLDRQTNVEFDESDTFQDLLDLLKKDFDIEAELDKKNAGGLGFTLNSPIVREPVKYEGIKIRSVLRLILSDCDLTYQIKDGKLWITSEDEARKTQSYKVGMWNRDDIMPLDIKIDGDSLENVTKTFPDFQLSPPGPFAVKSEQPSRTPMTTGDPIVATTYFYWYNIDTNAHFRNADGSDALTTHPATTEGMSWKNPEWHKKQFRQMVQAGIDIAMPVYWGSPTERQPDGMMFSDEGVPKMVEALDAMLENREVAPTLAMFYDTSTISHNIGNYHVDLTTDAGKRWFYGTIRNFFSLVPPKHRATIDGKPVVFLYAAAFAKNVDDTLFPAVRDMFRNDFGSDLYIVKTVEWPGRADSTYQWGAAINFQIHEAAAVGPGYDHSAVPGRTPLIRDRENGDFYTIGWERLLKRAPKTRPFLVHVETWNEFHEGTDICESKEYGTKYIEMTRKFSDLFHAGKQIAEYTVKPKHPNPTARPGEEKGITAVEFAPPGDGPVEVIEVGGMKAWTTRPVPGAMEPRHRYFYFDVDSMCLLDPPETVEVKVTYQLGPNADENSFAMHYDSRDPNRTGIQQQFKEARPIHVEQIGEWKTAVYRLSDAAFENRSNGSDFRLYAAGDDIIVREISVTIR